MARAERGERCAQRARVMVGALEPPPERRNLPYAGFGVFVEACDRLVKLALQPPALGLESE